MKRIEEFEGLRGLLAMWVVISHVVAISGYPWSGFRQPISTFVNGTFAVDVFIILSGFVISMLIMTRQEPFGLFIGRRFLRLYPAYLICVIAAFILSLVGVVPKNYQDAYIISHIVAHLTMLHGAIPNRILPHAASAFLNPAWSISIEWQFYLMIPLFFAAFRRYPLLAWAGLLVVALFGSRLAGRLGSWDHAAFLALKLNFFAVGVLCYFVFRWLDNRKETFQDIGPYITATLLAFTLMFSVFTSQFGLYIWLIAFGSMIATRLNNGTAFDKATSALLKSKFFQWLGTISYSVYLSHEIMIWVAVKILKTTVPTMPKPGMLLGITILAIPATLVLSYLLFHLVESPAIQFGKRLGKRDSTPKTALDSASNA